MTMKLLTPNERADSWLPTILWIVLLILGWEVLKPTVFPGPLDVLMVLPTLLSDGIMSEVLSSLMVNVEALALSALIGLPIAYLARVPAFLPASQGLAKLRFVGSAVFYLPLMLVLPSNHMVKVGLLMLGELFYLVTTMMGVVLSIPDFKFDDARTLNMSEWRSMWYVTIRGTVSEAITAIKDNAGMGWSMLMFVEGIIRSEGGVGVVILNAEKHVDYDVFFAVVVVIVLVGILQDQLLGWLRKVTCPYAN